MKAGRVTEWRQAEWHRLTSVQSDTGWHACRVTQADTRAEWQICIQWLFEPMSHRWFCQCRQLWRLVNIKWPYSQCIPCDNLILFSLIEFTVVEELTPQCYCRPHLLVCPINFEQKMRSRQMTLNLLISANWNQVWWKSVCRTIAHAEHANTSDTRQSLKFGDLQETNLVNEFSNSDAGFKSRYHKSHIWLWSSFLSFITCIQFLRRRAHIKILRLISSGSDTHRAIVDFS